MKKLKLVMIGNGMAGVRTLEELLKLTNELYDITVFGAEPHPNYNRILLSPVLAGEQQFEEIVLNDLDWYAENDIRLMLNRKVMKIDRARRRVIADDGSEAEYDRLLIATGSNPFILPIPGKDLQGVIGYRDIADTQVMMDTAKTHKHAVVIGGGLLGLEAANGLKLRGMDVTVVHIGDWLMERQLDRTAGTLLQSALESRGLKFLLPKHTAELLDNGEGRVCAVKFKDGEVIPADLVVMAAGIRPNSELAEQAGIPCNRGILVNDTLQTYDPRIYAVGECANHRGTAYGLVAPLFEQAKVCANHLAMLGFSRYLGSVTSTKLKVTGIDLFSAGDFIGGDGTETITLSDPIGGVYKKLVIKDDVLVGACLYGDTADGGWYFRQVREGQNVAQIRDHLMFGAAGLGEGAIGDAGHQGQNKAMSMPDDMEVCGCNGVCKGTIVKAIQAHGLFSVDEVKKHTKAASSCGSCAGLVEQILINTVGGAADVKPKSEKAICGCSDLNHGQVRKAIREHHLTSIPAAMAFMEWRTPNGCATCRQNSTQMGIDLEHALFNMWSPHKVKLAVSGCPRNCAESGIKDVGIIGVDSGWELYIGGNGGIKTEAGEFFVKVRTAEEVMQYSLAFLQLYREEAFYLERTVHYLQRVGMDHIKQAVLDDADRRQALHQRLLFSLSFEQDPWQEQLSKPQLKKEFDRIAVKQLENA